MATQLCILLKVGQSLNHEKKCSRHQRVGVNIVYSITDMMYILLILTFLFLRSFFWKKINKPFRREMHQVLTHDFLYNNSC